MTLKLKRKQGVTIFSLGILISLFVLTSCLNDDDNYIQQPVAFVSIYHASPNTEDLDILIGDRTVPINNGSFAYGDLINYLPVVPGNRKFKFTEAEDAGNVHVDTALTFNNYQYYTIYISNAGEDINTFVVTDSTEHPASGKAMIRFINLSPDSPEVDVVANSNTLFEDQDYRSGTAFKEVNADTYTLTFRSSEDEEILLITPDIELKAGSIYTLLLKGFVDPPAGNTNDLSTDIYRN